MDRRRHPELWKRAPLEEKLDRKLAYARWTTENICHEDCKDRTLDEIFDLLHELKNARPDHVYSAIKHSTMARITSMKFLGIEDLEWKEIEWECFP